MEPLQDSIELSELPALYNILMYGLMKTLAQDAIKQKFVFAYKFSLFLELLSAFSTNWQIKSKIRLYIN